MNKISTLTLPDFMTARGIGFDRMFDMLDDVVRFTDPGSYPPYNLIKTSEDTFVLEFALAGFTRDELSVTQKDNSLVIEGKKENVVPPGNDANEGTFLHRGISSRSFTQKFVLAEHMKVDGGEFTDGMLQVKLRREVPEEMKPRTIEIN